MKYFFLNFAYDIFVIMYIIYIREIKSHHNK